MKISLLLVIGLVAIIGTAQAWTGFNSVVSRLVDYQTPSGGFRGLDGKPSTEATANALLLASLYGLRSKINTTEVSKYITSIENKDGGYAPTTGAPSDVEAVRNALLALQHLGGKPSNPTNVLNYIKSLVDTNTHLFAVRSGEKGSVKGTALALESLELLGELNQKWVQDEFPKIKEYLTKARAAGDVLFFNFPEEKAVSQVTANYYGIIVAKYVGFDFGDASKWAKYITGLQSATGQFYDNADKKVTSLASTAHALHALNTLGGLKGATERFVDSVNVDNLKKGVRHIANDVTAAAHAHSAIALTKAFKDFFRAVVNYEGGAEEGVIEGSNLKPSLSVTSLFDEKTALPHGDFDVSSLTTFQGKEASKGKLTWDQELQRYVGEHLPTVGNLGPVKLAFNLVHKVAGLGELAFDILETKSVGYGLTVVPKVQQDGREIREGESVSVGTDFKFNVGLSTRANDNLQTGDFVVNFSVLDSSNVAIHQEKIDGASNKGPITFSYKLSKAAVPTGKLTFRVDVASKGLVSPHTTRSVTYVYSAPLVATNIKFDGVAKGQAPTFKLGDKVKVTIEPASFPDLRTPHVLPAEGSDKRNFVLDIKSPQGVLIRTVPGTVTKGSSKYTFESTVEPVLESIGTNVLSFRYIPAEGEEVTLQNYDTETGELYEDIHVLSYTVKADLSFTDVTGPKAGDLYYGGNVEYKFRVKDNLSGKQVSVSDKALANVFLDLQHEGEAGSRPWTSVHHPATVDDKTKGFSVDWIVNPNAVKGAGSILLSILDVDGTPIAVKEAKPIKVNIGGDINVEPHTYTTTITSARQTAIVAEFGLSTRNKTLKDAELSASLVRVSDGAVVATLPVAHHNGRYTVSWTAIHKLVPSGQYKLHFFRDVDRVRAQEKREQREKKERKERQLRGDTTTTTTTTEEEALAPLFVIDVNYSAPKFTSLPVRAEFLAFVALSVFLVWLSVKRTDPK